MGVVRISGVVGSAAGVGSGDWQTAVQDLTALKALGTGDRSDKQIRLVEDQGYSYRFDEQSTAVSNEPDVAVPADSPSAGRWTRIVGLGGDVVGPSSSTDNAIARYSGTGGKTIQASTVYVDDSGNLGVGTASPAKNLHVYGASGEVELRIQSDVSFSSIVHKDSGNELIIQNAATDGVTIFHDDTTERMRIDKDGNVGIGTNAPADKFHVVGDAALVGDVGVGIANPAKNLHVYGASGEVELRIQSDTSFCSIVQKDNNEMIIQNAAGGGVMIFHDDSAERMRIDTDGNVGIGTSSPNCMLHVSGAAAFSGPSETYVTFGSSDTTPSVATGNLFVAPGAVTITTFDDGVAGQTITVISTAAVVFDVTGTTLKGGSADVTTASGDVTTWTFDGTNWYLVQFMDVSADMSSVGGGGGSAADDISVGDAAVSVATSSGSVTVDSQASTVLVDGHTGVEVTSTGSGIVTIDGKVGFDIQENGQSVITCDTNADVVFGQTGGSASDPDVEFDGFVRFDDTISIGADADGTDRKIVFGHSTVKSVMGIDNDTEVFAINTDASFQTINPFAIDASDNVMIGLGTLKVRAKLLVGDYNQGDASNTVQIDHEGDDGDDGIIVVVSKTNIAADDILGGIGFDSTDGNVPSSVTEASAFIAGYASEFHSANDKGGYLVFGTTTIDDNDDTASHEWMRIKDDGHITITSATANATGGGADGSGGEGIEVYVGKVNGEIVTTILIDLTDFVDSGAVGDVIGEDGVAAAYLTQITSAVNGVIYKVEMSCVEVPAGSNCALDIDLSGNSTSLAEDVSLGSGGTTTSLILAGADWTAGTRRVSTAGADLSGLVDDYLYLSDGTGGASGGTYTGGKFVIKLYGSDF